MIENQVAKMREYFLSGGMREISTRRELLKKLKQSIVNHIGDIASAMKNDFNKNAFDVYATEIGIVLEELSHMIRRLKRYAKIKKVKTSLINFPSKGYIYPEGYGVALIIAPWNYPFQLSIAPLIGAVAAGNCVVLKPASRTKNTADIIQTIVGEVFNESQAIVVRSSGKSSDILDVKFDYIFFTGGAETGVKVMEKAAKFLTPLSLELGGKSPCIVDKSADLPLAARRIAWGKFINGGQTCVAPDYLLVHSDVKEEFLKLFIAEIKKMYYVDGKLSDEFAHLSDEYKAQEMKEILKDALILEGGAIEGRVMQPTLLAADFDSPAMAKEIFAPLMPVIEFNDIGGLIKKLNSFDRPLALYYFGKNDEQILACCPFGGGCINDVITHVSESSLPFGGVGKSGMGSYHGKQSFDTFTHYKSVLKKGKFDIKTRYAPHSEGALNFVKKLMK